MNLVQVALTRGLLRSEDDAATIEYLDLTLVDSQELLLSSLDGAERFSRLRGLVVVSSKQLSLRALAGLKHLEVLTVQAQRVSDLDALSQLPHLKTVELYTRVQGALTLRSDSLTTLRAEGCGISSVDLDAARLETLELGNNKKLTTLVLGKMGRLRRLGLAEVPLESLDRLEGCTVVEDLDLGSNTKLGDFDFTRFTKVKSLNLSRTSIVDLSPLASLEALEKLALTRTRVKTLKPLLGLAQLRELDICGSRVKSIDGIQALGRLEMLACDAIADLEVVRDLPSLKFCTGFRPPLDRTANAGPRVETLVPRGDVFLLLGYGQRLADPSSWKGLRALRVNHELPEDRTSLSQLALTHLWVKPAIGSLEQLPPMPTLEHLQVSSGGLSLAGIERFPRLQTLVVSGSTGRDLTPLAGAPQLLALELGTCRTHDLGPLLACAQLRHLALYGAGEARVDTDVVTRLSTLRTLRLGGATYSQPDPLRAWARNLDSASIA